MANKGLYEDMWRERERESEVCGILNNGPCVSRTVFFVANCTKTTIKPDPSVTKGSLWQTFEKMAYI